MYVAHMGQALLALLSAWPEHGDIDDEESSMRMHCHGRQTRSEATCQGLGRLPPHLRRICHALFGAAVLLLMRRRISWNRSSATVHDATLINRPPRTEVDRHAQQLIVMQPCAQAADSSRC